MLKKSQVLKEGYRKGLRDAIRVIESIAGNPGDNSLMRNRKQRLGAWIERMAALNPRIDGVFKLIDERFQEPRDLHRFAEKVLNPAGIDTIQAYQFIAFRPKIDEGAESFRLIVNNSENAVKVFHKGRMWECNLLDLNREDLADKVFIERMLEHIVNVINERDGQRGDKLSFREVVSILHRLTDKLEEWLDETERLIEEEG